MIYDEDGDLYEGQGRFSVRREIPASNYKVTSRHITGMNGIYQGLKTEPVEFHDRTAAIVRNQVERAFQSDFPERYLVEERFLPLLGNECKRFICALAGYFASPNPLLSKKYLFEGIQQRDFAATLKKNRTAAWTRKFRAVPDEEDGLDSYTPTRTAELSDIGDIFNYRYWFRWQEPDPMDYKYTQVGFDEPTEDVKEKWKEALRRVLPQKHKQVHGDEVLLSMSSSSSRTEDGARSKVYKDKCDPKKNYFSRTHLKGWRTSVYKGPTETRDCLTLSIAQSNTVKWIEKQMASIASETIYSAYGMSPRAFEEELDDFYDPDGFYYNRDLTKEGLTKPRWILKAIQEVCQERWPENPIWEYFSIYKNLTLMLDGGVKLGTARGHGLGMANALTTIMQCATFSYILAEATEDGEIAGEMDALFYNDDATIKGTDDVSVLTYSQYENQKIVGLGLLPKESKTYSSKVMVLCERYYPKELGVKASYTSYIRRLPFAATNIVVAKTQYYMVEDPAFGALDVSLLPLLISFWGCEHSMEEYNLPWWAGGWLAPKYNGVDLTFMDPIPESQYLYRGINVGPPILKPERFRERNNLVLRTPISYTHNFRKDLVTDLPEMFDLEMTPGQLAAKFHRSHDEVQTSKWYQHILIERFNTWKTPARPRSLVNIYKEIVTKYKFIDFIPPEGEFDEKSPDSVMDKIDRRPQPPEQPNKLLGSLCFFSGQKYIKGVIPYPYLQGHDKSSMISPDRLDRFNESILSLPGVSKLVPVTIPYEIEGALRERFYNDDYAVFEAYLACTARIKFPKPHFMSKGGEVNNKYSKYLWQADYFGKPEYWDLWLKVGRTITLIFMSGRLTAEEWEEILEETGNLEPLPEVPEPIPLKSGRQEILESDDFWTWRDNPRTAVVSSHLIHIYEQAAAAYSSSMLVKTLTGLSSGRTAVGVGLKDTIPREGSGMDILIRKFTNLCGETTAEGVYLYGIPATNVFDDSGSNSDWEGGGLFGDTFD